MTATYTYILISSSDIGIFGKHVVFARALGVLHLTLQISGYRIELKRIAKPKRHHLIIG